MQGLSAWSGNQVNDMQGLSAWSGNQVNDMQGLSAWSGNQVNDMQGLSAWSGNQVNDMQGLSAWSGNQVNDMQGLSAWSGNQVNDMQGLSAWSGNQVTAHTVQYHVHEADYYIYMHTMHSLYSTSLQCVRFHALLSNRVTRKTSPLHFFTGGPYTPRPSTNGPGVTKPHFILTAVVALRRNQIPR